MTLVADLITEALIMSNHYTVSSPCPHHGDPDAECLDTNQDLLSLELPFVTSGLSANFDILPAELASGGVT